MAPPLILDGSALSGASGRDLLTFKISPDNTAATIYITGDNVGRLGLAIWDASHGQWGTFGAYSINATDALGGFLLNGARILYDDGYTRFTGTVASSPTISLGHGGVDNAWYVDADIHHFRTLNGLTEFFVLSSGNVTLPVNSQALNFTDTSGTHPNFITQGDNNFVFYGTNATGAARGIWSCSMRSSTSRFVLGVDAQLPTSGKLFFGSAATDFALRAKAGSPVALECVAGDESVYMPFRASALEAAVSAAETTVAVRRLGTPGAGMMIGAMVYLAQNNADVTKAYARVRGEVESHVSLAEYGRLHFCVLSNGAEVTPARILSDGLHLNTAGPILFTDQACTNYAGSGAGTLSNAPTAGNPSKWISINDGGVIRKIPTWL